MRTVAIHQPEYFPWPGYLEKIRRSDVFVLLDSVQFDRSSLQQRARVMGANGPVWMSIPFVHKFPQRIDEVVIAEQTWREKQRKTLQACYGRAPGFAAVSAALEPFFARPYERLVDATVATLELLLRAFGLEGKTEIVRASSLPVTGSRGDLVLALCQHLGATRYLSGKTGASYLDAGLFAREGIEIEVQSYTVPAYPRQPPLTGQESGLSALDAWMFLGDRAPSLLFPAPEPVLTTTPTTLEKGATP
jgi:hypothetical protein